MKLRLPKITGKTEREQLDQIKSYLKQLIPELQFALNHIESRLPSASTAKSETHSSISNNINFQ